MRSGQGRYLFTCFVVFICAFFAVAAPAQDKAAYADEIAALEHYIEGQMQFDRIPGLSIAIYYGDFSWSRGFGYADLENRVPATDKTMYRWASVGKPMTAVGIVKLASDGKLNLDDEARTYVPYFPEKQWPVRIRQLLGHIGGISHYKNYDVEGSFKVHYTTEQSIGVFKDWDLVAEPGSRYQYSSYGYNLLGAVIEGASGMNYADYMTQNVWQPMGMLDTRMDDPDDIIPNRSRGYRIVGGKVINSEYVDISSRFGAGGTRTTVVDLVKFARALDDGKVLSMAQQEQMYDTMYLADGSKTNYGMGWGTSIQQGMYSVGHSGSQAEVSTYFIRVPRKRFAVAVASNREDSGSVKYARAAVAIFLNSFRFGIETRNEADREILPLIVDMWNLGAAYVERHGSAMSADSAKLDRAFAEINNLFFSEPGNKSQEYQTAETPESGHLITTASSYIASQLLAANGKERFAHYQQWQPFDYFADYIALYKADSPIPESYRFTNEVENRIAGWQAEWSQVWTDEMRRFFTIPDSELGSAALRLNEIAANASIYPRFNTRLNSLAYKLNAQDRTREGLAVLELAAEAYPSDANLLDSIGEFHLTLGERDKAIEFYRAAVDKNPGYLNSRYVLASLQPANVSIDTLSGNAGVYLLGELEIDIVIEDGRLLANVPGTGTIPLIPESEDSFISREPDGNVVLVQFIKSNGVTESMKVTFPDSTVNARKIR